MKEQIIEAAGKTWQYLGKNGETCLSDLARLLKEKDEVVFQAIGWLAREDKINYSAKNKKEFVGLVEGELNAFRSTIQNIENGAAQEASAGQAKARTRGRAASRI